MLWLKIFKPFRKKMLARHERKTPCSPCFLSRSDLSHLAAFRIETVSRSELNHHPQRGPMMNWLLKVGSNLNQPVCCYCIWPKLYIIFHQARFPSNKGMSLTKLLPFGGKSVVWGPELIWVVFHWNWDVLDQRLTFPKCFFNKERLLHSTGIAIGMKKYHYHYW